MGNAGHAAFGRRGTVAENAIVRAEKMRLTLAYTKAWNGRPNVSMRDGARFYCRSIMIAGSFLTINYKGKRHGRRRLRIGLG